MPATAEYDLQGLNNLVSALQGAVLADGRDGDIHRVLIVETAQLATDISNALGPDSQAAGTSEAERDVKRFLTDKPKYSNLEDGQQYSSTADFTWLQAGPHFLMGINDEDNQLNASGEDALQFFRAGQKAGSRGATKIELGQRGKQHIYRLNRTRVSTSAKRSVIRSISAKVGTLKASFAFAAAQLMPSKKVPQWIARHFGTKANGRALFNDAGLNGENPFIEFGSTAPGVESNSRIAEIISGQIEKRKHIVLHKINKVLAGYCYDWNNGRVFRRQEAKEEEES